ncbi:hypothetical protein Ddye_018760 [Dipteronia dyeriana]|uniref:Uncharacterized protein n=1 Tax=Dipteronia dyeriana TaxID=168575 RepID=A0AAD9X1P5_9ROSI|nr:hypothetical protein Ddye_018760 [Dipteronia dyeriana]
MHVQERKQRSNVSKDDVRITQGTAPPQPSGIPTYMVEITNMCRTTGCAIEDIKLYCAGFTSANLINPLIFRHLPTPNHDYCIVNNGNPLNAGAVLSFHYNFSLLRYLHSIVRPNKPSCSFVAFVVVCDRN